MMVSFSSRLNDVVLHDNPRWLLEPPDLVQARRVLVVNEICSSGQTWRDAVEKVDQMGAAVVKTAVLYAHT